MSLVLDRVDGNSDALTREDGEPTTTHVGTTDVGFDAETALGGVTNVAIATSNHDMEVAMLLTVIYLDVGGNFAALPYPLDVGNTGVVEARSVVGVD